MTLIRIREGAESPNATVSFDHGEEYPITITDPFSEQEEKRLEWYFEGHLRFPFTDQVIAKQAADSVTNYGEKLFQQVFADPDVYSLYKAAMQAGVETLTFEIAGSPDFHRLHWETIKDPKRTQPLALHIPIMRRNLIPQIVKAKLRPSPTINLLIVTARPGGAKDVGYRTISRPLVDALRQADLRVRMEMLRPGTYEALTNHLEKHGTGHYHVIHFDVHGALHCTALHYHTTSWTLLGILMLENEYSAEH